MITAMKILVFVGLVVLFSAIWCKAKQKKEQDGATRRRDELKQKVVEGMVVEPQMGHAITPGVIPDWEKRRQQEQAFEEISKLLWRKEKTGCDPDSEPVGIE